MATKKSLKIHKKNEIIRGADDYSLFAKRAMNAIYYYMQKENLYRYEILSIPFNHFRALLNLENEQNYVEIMKQAFLELKKPIELNNFTHPDGTIYRWYATSFLNDVGFVKKNHRWYVKMEVNGTLKRLMQRKENFTELDLLVYQNKTRTKYAMKLYEFIKSFSKYRYIDLSAHHVRKLFRLEESKTYKNFSDLKRLLERQIKEIKTKTDLQNIELQIDKKNKAFRVIINPKASKETTSEQETEKKMEEFLRPFPHLREN